MVCRSGASPRLPINTTSKLGLPSNTLLRNQHGETRDTRQTKHESATTRRESNTHATKPTRPQWNLRARSVRTSRDPALTWGGNRREPRHNENRIWSIEAAVAKLRARSVRTLRDPTPTWGGTPGSRKVRSDLAIRMVLITTFSKGAIPLPCERSCRTIFTFVQVVESGRAGETFYKHRTQGCWPLRASLRRRKPRKGQQTPTFAWCSSPHFQRASFPYLANDPVEPS